MRVIKKVIKNMNKRLALAECDIDLAIKYKEQYPELSKAQYILSTELMDQFKTQHEQINAIITLYKREGKQVPEGMQAIYDYLHKEYMDWASEIKVKQEMYKN